MIHGSHARAQLRQVAGIVRNGGTCVGYLEEIIFLLQNRKSYRTSQQVVSSAKDLNVMCFSAKLSSSFPMNLLARYEIRNVKNKKKKERKKKQTKKHPSEWNLEIGSFFVNIKRTCSKNNRPSYDEFLSAYETKSLFFFFVRLRVSFIFVLFIFFLLCF